MQNIFGSVTSLLVLMSFFATLARARANECGLPLRSNGSSWSSADFYAKNNSPGTARELAVVAEVMKGNVPNRLRTFEVLQLPMRWRGQNVTFQIDVAPDYLAIGTDDDFVRAPLTPFAAQYLASEMGYVLPTTYLVDRIYDQADTKLLPQPTDWYKNSPSMRYGSNYVIFNQAVEGQRAGRGGLVAGHKKDVVLTNRLDSKPTRVAIYGWQRLGNKPIQPLALPHDAVYEDYSHGIRLLGPNLRIVASDGRTLSVVPMPQALNDSELGPLLNGGARLNDVRAGRECTSEFAAAMGLSRANCPPQPRLCP